MNELLTGIVTELLQGKAQLLDLQQRRSDLEGEIDKIERRLDFLEGQAAGVQMAAAVTTPDQDRKSDPVSGGESADRDQKVEGE